MMEKVALVKVGENTVYDAVKECISLLGGMESFVKPGMRVMLKPNYTGNLPADSGGVTSLSVLEAVIRLLRECAVGEITILEGCGTVALGTEKIFQNLGVARLAHAYQVKLMDANLEKMKRVSCPGFREMKEIEYVDCLDSFDLIVNLPVMKTHPLVDVTVAMKNMNGLLSPWEKRHFHEGNLRQSIVDFHQVLPQYLTIVDGLTAMEGMGPAEGSPVELGVILAGTNPAAVDATAARIMGFTPEKIKYLEYAADCGIGPIREEEIQVLGTEIRRVRREFRPAAPEPREYPGIRTITGDSETGCVGCSAVMHIALGRILAAGQMDAFRGMQVLLNGSPKEDICFDKLHPLFCIGACTVDFYERNKTKPGIYHIKGCAPAGLTVEDAVRHIYGVSRPNVEMTAARP